MSTRGVSINFPVCPDPRVVAWLEANSIDPASVPAAQELLVTEDHIAYVVFQTGDDGKKIRGSDSFLKQIKVAELIAAPENFGL